MSTFEHMDLMSSINANLAEFRQSQPEVAQSFAQLAKSALAVGAIDAKHKELIALAIGVSQHCSGCIAFHTKALHKLGATRQEIDEVLSICVYMGGGPSLMYAAEAVNAWNELNSAHEKS